MAFGPLRSHVVAEEVAADNLSHHKRGIPGCRKWHTDVLDLQEYGAGRVLDSLVQMAPFEIVFGDDTSIAAVPSPAVNIKPTPVVEPNTCI